MSSKHYHYLSAAIANLFAKEKDTLTKSLVEKEDHIDELKLKIYRLENEVQSLKVRTKPSYNACKDQILRWYVHS